ncbi:MAG: molybdopterin-dependent oxidoreductase [Deltaproteobacteria bacterium]|nr:molybdopterin-dependent oxidoreductase [Deltaproteobacteria bacterium]MBW2696719.1 molybdopterin-dependent oxidoreductase [Deltaproteobacteria bacterium]
MSGGRGVDRRTFLQSAAAGSVWLGLGLWRLQPRPGIAATGIPASYGDWRDIYRERWAWDEVVRSSHWVNCWYQAHCAWNVYVKDGMVWREEQAADYPQVRPDVPDFNPRGCQKGACFSERMYDPSRVRYPLKRVGERGSGRWKRVSWDEALDEIADSIIDTIVEEGSDRVIWDPGPGISLGTQTAAHARLRVLLDSTNLDMNTEIGDGHRGAAETFGKIVFERSADDYFFSDLILCWGANPAYTQIPNAHFMTEARYKGAEFVCITPDYSASAMHADHWIPVKPGGDAALGLGMAQVLIAENLLDRRFVQEQTDLPLLVRDDTHRFLRNSDLEAGGDEGELYLHDSEQGVVPAPRRSLELKGLDPSLEGRFEVTLHDGRRVAVRPVFALLREQLEDYTPEKAAALSGTPAAMIRSLARKLGGAKAASMVTTSNFAKCYHGNLVERAQALVFALTGNYGKKGSGFVGFPFLMHDGLDDFVLSMFDLPIRMFITASGLIDEARLRLAGWTDEMIVYERSRRGFESGQETSGALFWYIHGGLLEASESLQDWDPYLERPVKEVLDESLAKGWQHVWPKPGNDPRVMISLVSNPLRRIRSYPLVLKNLWPKLRTVVVVDWRMTSTALWSDFVLPAAAWYERTEHKWVTPLMPFIHAGKKAVSYYEAKSDWEIFSRMAQAIDRRAAERGITEFQDRTGRTRSFEGLYRQFSSDGEYGHTDDDKVARTLIENASNLEGVEWEELRDRGWARFTDVGKSIASIGTATQIKPNDTITPFTDHVFEKKPYPTLSRRIQFYLDQDLYLEMKEMLPVHKDPPKAGGDYPLTLSGGHTRWSIHSAWRDDRLMLQQQRGVPVAWMNDADARARGISDGEDVRVYNDLDEFQIMVKLAPGVRRGQFIVYHAWDNFQFKGQKGYQNLIPTPLNPVELAGGQFHLRPMSICLQPSHTDRDTRVEVARL